MLIDAKFRRASYSMRWDFNFVFCNIRSFIRWQILGIQWLTIY